MKPNKKTIALARGYGFDTAEYLYSKDGYDIFAPVDSNSDGDIPFIGEPIYIVQKGQISYVWQGIGDPLLLKMQAKKG